MDVILVNQTHSETFGDILSDNFLNGLRMDLLRFANRRLQRHEFSDFAEDLATETLEKLRAFRLCQCQSSLELPENVARGLAFGIAKKCILDRRRSAKREHEVLSKQPDRSIGHPNNRLELQELLNKCQEVCSPDDWLLLREKYENGRPSAEIAEERNTTVNAIDIRTSRAKKAIRERLQWDEGHDRPYFP